MMLYVILVFKLKLPSRHFSDEPENSSLLLPAPTPSTTPIPRTLYKRYRSDSKMTYFLAPPYHLSCNKVACPYCDMRTPRRRP